MLFAMPTRRRAAMRRWTVALAGAGLLLILAGLILWHEAALDARIYAALRLRAPHAWAVALTDAGSGAAMIPLALSGVLFLALTGRRPTAFWLFAAVASGRLVLELAKIEVARGRPAVRLVEVTSSSFPSSHTAGATLTMLTLCAAFGSRPALWATGALFAVAVGFSRVGLGVHWPSDVLAGWGAGMLWTALWMAAANAGRRTDIRS